MLSIPCVFQYNILKIEKYGLNIGVNLGVSFDRFSGFNYDYRIIRSDEITQTTYDVLIKSDIGSQNSFPFDNFSGRYGFVIGKTLSKNHGRLELNVQWMSPRRISSNLDFDISRKIETNGVLISDQNFKPSYSLIQKGCNIGFKLLFWPVQLE
ncbi:MAG: hypothetical protein IPO92_09540 [Saprospiraceae bacterium]|nr:hypothetical protein [Saprospiraceae bacterium]